MIERMAAGVFILLLILSACGPDPTPKPLREYEILATAAVIQTRNARQSRPGTRKTQQHNEPDWRATDAAFDRWQATQDALYADDLATERAAIMAATMDAMMAEAYATDMAMLTKEAETHFPDNEPDGPCDPPTRPSASLLTRPTWIAGMCRSMRALRYYSLTRITLTMT